MMPPRSSLIAIAIAIVIAPVASCARPDAFVWVDDIKESLQHDDAYLIGVGDMVAIQVWNQEKMSARVRVRSDGRVSIPFLNDVEVAGKSPVKIARELEASLKDYVLNPMVYVVIEESKPLGVSVMGEVSRPGLYPLENGAGVAQALASAGGLNEFADRKRIFVVRRGSKVQRVRFTYEALVRAEGNAHAFRLRAGDVVVVE